MTLTDPSPPLTDLEQREIVEQWLGRFADLLATRDPGLYDGVFAEDGWWRDLLAFSWDLRTLHGAGAIASFLAATRDRAPGEVAPRPGFAPSVVEIGGRTMLQATFVVEVAPLRALGIVRLLPGQLRSDPWTAATVLTVADELIGREEAIGARRPYGTRRGAYDHPAATWAQRRGAEVSYEDREPEVVVIGAGHSGLGLGARLGRLGVDTLIVERNAAVGDNWRHRYESLALHDPVWGDHLPYLPFPGSWPVFTPKDLLAEWLESYARLLELNVWTGTEIVGCSYDDAEGRWTIELDRAGVPRVVRPAHLVFATGTSGNVPRIPELPGREDFGGPVLHSSRYVDGAPFAGRRVVVVGAGTSGHDIAQNLYEHGAQVTMIQRGSTCVVDDAKLYLVEEDRPVEPRGGLEGGIRVEDADLIAASYPYLAGHAEARADVRRREEREAALLTGLNAAGFATNSGLDGRGIFSLYLEQGGGYYMNVGASDLIVQGRIAVRSGVGIERLTRAGVVLTDGGEIPADAVVLATGFQLMGDTVRAVVGDAEAGRCGPIWGLDAEGELRSMWRPTGHPGLWMTGGNLWMSRYFGRLLALQLSARVAGLVDDRSRRETS